MLKQLPNLKVVVLVLRGGRRYGGDAEEDVRVCLGQSVHYVALVALGGERVLAPAHLRQPGQPEVHLLRRDGRGGRGEELAGLEIEGIIVKKSPNEKGLYDTTFLPHYIISIITCLSEVSIASGAPCDAVHVPCVNGGGGLPNSL